MMTDIRFYHLRRDTADKAIPDLLAKALANGHKIYLKMPTPARCQYYDDWLWRYRDDTFLPHAQDGDPSPHVHPIWIGTGDDAPNGATMAIAAEGATLPPPKNFKLMCFVFSSEHEAELNLSRALWSELKKNSSVSMTYWQQQENGAWEKQTL